MYSNEAPGTVCAQPEYTYHDVVSNHGLEINSISMPVFAGIEAMALSSNRVTRLMACTARRDETPPKSFVNPPHMSTKEGSGTHQNDKNKQNNEESLDTQSGENLRSGEQAKRGRGRPRKVPMDPPVPTVKPLTLPTAGGRSKEGEIRSNPESPDDAAAEPNGDQTSTLDSQLDHMDNSLLNVVNSGWLGLDLLELMTNHYADDPFFKHILDNLKAFRNFEIDNGRISLKEDEHRVLCIHKLVYKDQSVREIVISEAHSILAHLGLRKTLDYLRDHFWWKEMVEDTRSFCESCATCKHSKLSNQKPYGLLHSLNCPQQPSDFVGVDFVSPLRESKNWLQRSGLVWVGVSIQDNS